MARLVQGFVALSAALLLLLSWLPISLAASKKPAAVTRREDIPFIKCQVCEKVAHQIYHQVKKKEADIAPKKVSEYQIIEIAENVCNLKKEQADWILQIDIVENGEKLEFGWNLDNLPNINTPSCMLFHKTRMYLVEQGTEGQCNSECKTIEHTCQEVIGYSDTDVAEFLFKKKPSVGLLVNFLCNDLSKACSVKPPPVPKDRTPGEPFVAKSSKDAEMEKILRSMEGMPGAPSMKMYSREDLMNMNNFGDGEADEDDDDEEADFPAKLSKVIQGKDSPKKDLKQRILQRITQTGASIKQHANKAQQKIGKWWKGKKAGVKPPKASKAEL